MQVEQLLKSKVFNVERVHYETSAGVPLHRDVIRHPGSVAIVPRLADGQICLIRNRRISVDSELIEIPAGTMEPPEPALDCAYRELTEETGYHAGDMRLVRAFYPAPGILDERMHLYEARDLTPGNHAREVGEEIDNLIVTLREARAMIQDGRIQDAKTIIGLLLVEDDT